MYIDSGEKRDSEKNSRKENRHSEIEKWKEI